MILNVWFPSSMSSFIPVIVIVCAIFQFPGVKVTFTGSIVPSVISSEFNPIVTLAVGSVFSTIVNVAIVPSSTVLLLTEEMVTPAASLSVLSTDTV